MADMMEQVRINRLVTYGKYRPEKALLTATYVQEEEKSQNSVIHKTVFFSLHSLHICILVLRIIDFLFIKNMYVQKSHEDFFLTQTFFISARKKQGFK